MRTAGLLLGLVTVASIALTGCSKREDLKLAEFKDRSITIGQFENAYAKVLPEFLPKATGEEGKMEFLTTMLNREVMEAKADELGFDKDPAVAQGMEGFRKMTLQVAHMRKVVGEIKISEKELRDHYDKLGTSASVKQIICDRPDEAQAAHAALEGGQDFESVIKQYSKAEDAEEGGTVIALPYGQLMLEIQEPVFSLPVGGYTKPIATVGGWVILKVLKFDKTGKKPATFESMKPRLEEELKNSREAAAINRYTEKLREEYGVTWNFDALEIVYNALPPDRPLEEAPPRNQEVYPLLYFESADLDKPIVSYPGRTITIKDFSDLYDRASFYNRPRREMRLGSIRSFLMMNVMDQISGEVVRKSGIENDPEVKEVLKSKQEEIMVGLLYEDMVNNQVVATKEQMERYYSDNAEQFRQPQKRKFGLILTGDVDAARRAHEDLRAGKPVATVAAAYSIDEETLSNRGVTGELSKGDNPEIDAVGFAMTKVGQVSEPFQTSRGWMVLKLVEDAPERIFDFDEAMGRVEAAVREQEKEERLKELLAKWKDEYGVVIHEENLKKVKITERTGAEKPRARL